MRGGEALDVVSLTSSHSKSPSISESSLLLWLPSEPADVADDVESFPEMFGFNSSPEALHVEHAS